MDTSNKITVKDILQKADLNKIIILGFPFLFILLMLFHPFREAITPFLFAAIVAYILNPLIQLFSKRLHLPRIIFIIIFFAIFVFTAIYLLINIVHTLSHEITELTQETDNLNNFFYKNFQLIPDWKRLYGYFAPSLNNVKAINSVVNLNFLQNTASKLIHLFAFFVATFYFLKDANKIYKVASKNPLYKVLHETIQNYFRGQLILIGLMTALTWVFLKVIGIKFTFLLSLFTGFAEVIPYVGPAASILLAVAVTLFTQASAFGNPPLITALIVASGYLVLRQLEDFLFAPQVLSKSVDIHPLIILFTMLISGRLFGFVGLLLGLPFLALYKTLLEYTLNPKQK